MPANYTYSFADVFASLAGPGGNLALNQGGIATEGITVARNNPINSMQIGADGVGMHSLRMDKSGTVTLRLLKANPLNAQLSALYHYQTRSSAYHGQNTISVRNPVRGDDFTAANAGFRGLPNFNAAQDADTVEWVFDSTSIDGNFGDGTPGA